MGFEHSENLSYLILLMGAAALLLGGYFFYPPLRGRFRGGLLELVLKVAILAALAVGFLGPYYLKQLPNEAQFALVDISESVDEQAGEDLFRTLQSYQAEGQPIMVVPFAGNGSKASIPLSSIQSYRSLRDGFSKLNIGATDLAAGLSEALSQTTGGVLLVTDGHPTQGDAEELIPALNTARLKLYPLVPEQKHQGEKRLRISQLYVPLTAPAQKSVDIRVSVGNTTAVVQQGELEVKHDGRSVFRKEVRIEPQAEALFVAESDPSREGIKEITAELKPLDRSMAPSLERAFLSGEVREKVLLLSGAEEDRRLLDDMFRNQAYQLQSLVASGRLQELPDLEGVSTIILNNIGAQQLPYGAPSRIEKFTAAGGGLIMLGGNRSFGLGGYIGTDIAQALPVELVPPRAEEKRLDLAVELVIDKSRSMASDDRLEYSKEAAREVIRNLKDEDFVGVIGFDDSPFEVVKLGRVRDIRAHAMERVSRLFPDRRTNLFPSMEEARRRLEAADAGRKHMIVLTDGKLPDASQAYVEMVKEMRLLGITVSTVMIGSEYDAGFLRSLSEYGGGAYYQTDNPTTLPRIFIQDVKVRSGEKTMKEAEEFAVRTGPSGLKSTDIAAYPPLRGYVQTSRRREADLELVVTAAEKADPLLASWNYGQGRSIAFTSDANGRWSSTWAGWPKFQTFWSELVEAARAKGSRKEEGPIRFDLRRSVEQDRLILDLSVFQDVGNAEIRGSLLLPNENKEEMVFEKVAPGHYKAELPKVAAGKYVLEAAVGARKLTPVAFHLSGELFGEKKGQGFNVPLLERLASGTGGTTNPGKETLLKEKKVMEKRVSLLPYLLALAAALLCALAVWREVFAWRLMLRRPAR